jgi:hypothetical protein
MLPRTLTVVLMLAASTIALAHETKGPNGGRVVDAGSYHVELVAQDTAVDLYVTDGNDKPVPAAGFKAVAILVVAGKSQRIPLEPAEGSRLTGKAPVPIPANPKGAVQLTAPDGKTAQGRFN